MFTITTISINKLTPNKKKKAVFGDCLDSLINVKNIIKTEIYFIAVNMKNGIEVNNGLTSQPPLDIMIFVDIESIKFKDK